MVEFTPKEQYTMQDLVRIVSLLRQPEGGCPWDIEQTHESIRMNFIEETYEVLDAIDQKDTHLLEEELGDVLLQVVLHSQMEAERGTFDFDAVCDGICKKLIYRHPHVFGDLGSISSNEALANWEVLKNKEKGRQTAKDRLESVPRGFPALMRAAKLQKRAAAYGLGYSDAQDALSQMKQQMSQMEQAMEQGEDISLLLGEMLFAAAGLCRTQKQDPEQVLMQASDRFTAEAIRCEQLAEEKGMNLEQMDCQQREHLWQQAKEEQFSKA